MAIKNILSVPAVPNFPNGGKDYDIRYQNELNNVIRLYLNRLGGAVQSLVSPEDGGNYLAFPHVAASDTTNQYATAANTATKVTWNTEESNSGFTFTTSSSAICQYKGIYKITYSLQFANNDNAIHNANVWLKVNNVDVTRSATYFSVPARKSVGNPSYVCAYSEVVFSAESNDVITLYWATDQAATSGGATGVYIFADVAQTVPYARPAIPSAIGSIIFVSNS